MNGYHSTSLVFLRSHLTSIWKQPKLWNRRTIVRTHIREDADLLQSWFRCFSSGICLAAKLLEPAENLLYQNSFCIVQDRTLWCTDKVLGSLWVSRTENKTWQSWQSWIFWRVRSLTSSQKRKSTLAAAASDARMDSRHCCWAWSATIKHLSKNVPPTKL